MTQGRTIRMFLVDGSPGGIITAEIMNWTGHVLCAPRSRLPDLIKRDETKRTGIYFLSGIDPETGSKTQVYIGESDNVGKRLAQHNKAESAGGRDFWDKVCLVSSKDQNLTKTHVRFLESRLISICSETGRASLMNGTAPDYGYLPEADRADMEYFIDQIRIVLPVVGFDFLREHSRITRRPVGQPDGSAVEPSPGRIDVSPVPSDPPTFEIVSDRHDLAASAQEIDGEFIVLAGSTARLEWVGDQKWNPQLRRLHDQLKEDGIMQDRDGVAVFVRDYAFSSPSAAAAIVYGRSANGRTSWRLKDTKRTYADFQESLVEDASGVEQED
jgi:hypothetical protein